MTVIDCICVQARVRVRSGLINQQSLYAARFTIDKWIMVIIIVDKRHGRQIEIAASRLFPI